MVWEEHTPQKFTMSLLLGRIFLGMTFLRTSTHTDIGTHVLIDHLIRPYKKYLDIPYMWSDTEMLVHQNVAAFGDNGFARGGP